MSSGHRIKLDCSQCNPAWMPFGFGIADDIVFVPSLVLAVVTRGRYPRW